jgi:thioredoxin 1
MGANTVEVTADNFQTEVLDSQKAILVDFWAEWCGPCKMVAPVLEEIAAENSDKLIIGKLDIEEYPNIPQQFGITGIPTMILFKDGQEATRVIGFKPKDRIVKELEAHW